MTVIRFVVPGHPRGWKRTGQRIVQPKGKAPFIVNFTPEQTRAEESNIRYIAAVAMNGTPPLDGPIDLRLTAFFAVPMSWSQKKQALAYANRILPTRKPDFDNIAALVDAISGVVWRDDALICDCHIWKRYSDTPRIVIEARTMLQDSEAAQPVESSNREQNLIAEAENR